MYSETKAIDHNINKGESKYPNRQTETLTPPPFLLIF